MDITTKNLGEISILNLDNKSYILYDIFSRIYIIIENIHIYMNNRQYNLSNNINNLLKNDNESKEINIQFNDLVNYDILFKNNLNKEIFLNYKNILKKYKEKDKRNKIENDILRQLYYLYENIDLYINSYHDIEQELKNIYDKYTNEFFDIANKTKFNLNQILNVIKNLDKEDTKYKFILKEICSDYRMYINYYNKIEKTKKELKFLQSLYSLENMNIKHARNKIKKLEEIINNNNKNLQQLNKEIDIKKFIPILIIFGMIVGIFIIIVLLTHFINKKNKNIIKI